MGATMQLTPAQLERREASRQLLEAVTELGETLFDDALELCDDEREAAFVASATLLSALERERVLRRPARAA
jgi:hypothetical protein